MPHPRREPNLIEEIDKYAIFLDFDGTLAEIAPKPWLARLDDETLASLKALSQRVSGALAVVSGRQIEEIDTLVGLPMFPAAGIHGAQLRLPGGEVVTQDWMRAEIDAVEVGVRELIGTVDGSWAGVLIERKPVAVAIHFRANPSRSRDVRAIAAQLVEQRPQLRCLHGRKIVEILPAGIDKGKAITLLMQAQPFKGRIPIFAGDDLTDEDGLVAVRRLGGIGIKIGGGPSVADYGFETAAGFRSWLRRLAPTAGESDV